MLAHAAATAECEVDGVNTIDVENCKCSSAGLWTGARVFGSMSKLDDVSNFSETAVLKKSARPLLENVSL